jgi:hypothetical protein
MRDREDRAERATSVSHVEYEILRWIRESIDLTDLEREMCGSDVTRKRFKSGMEKIDTYLSNMMDRRRHRLKPTHRDYKEKGE